MSFEGLSIRDDLLQVVADICQTEDAASEETVDSKIYIWRADPAIFSRPIGIESARLDNGDFPSAIQAELSVADLGLFIKVRNDDGPLEADGLVIDVLEAFKTYYDHPHELCSKALERRLEKEKLARRMRKYDVKATDKRAAPLEFSWLN